MSIVDRIKLFISDNGLTVSQFADACEIPRPTVSQLLNGRNKKVSDEIFSKIHACYPSLSISWLMFGEGNMYVSSFVESSDASSSDVSINFVDDSASSGKKSNHSELFDANVSHLGDATLYESGISLPFSGIEPVSSSVESKGKVCNSHVGQYASSASAPQPAVRRIVNIMVFYSDNSFEYFVPKSSK